MTDSGESKLPLQYEDGPDFCTVRDAQGRDFALTMQPDLMKAMEKALSDEIASFMRAPVKCSSAGTAKADVLAHLRATAKQHDIYAALEDAAEEIARLRAVPQSSSVEDVRQLAEIAIRTFCQSLGAGAVTISSDGVERIYHAGINLKALSVAVAMAVTRPHGGGGS